MSNVDLSLDPTAVRPTNVRGVPQPILPKTPRTGNGTTSSGVCEGGGYSENQWAVRQRREDIARATAPTPTQAAANRWEAYESAWKTRIETNERQKLAEMRQRIARDEQKLAELNRRRENLKQFRQQEAIVELALSDLDPAEKSRVYERLSAAGKLLDADLASAYANEVIMSRGTAPVEQSVDAGCDWRSALKVKK